MGVQMRRQSGAGMLTILFWIIVLVIVAVIGMKLVPAYLEFFSVKRILSSMKADAAGGSVKEIRESFQKRAMVDDVTSVTSQDLNIERSGGRSVVTAEYQKIIPLFANVSLLVDFKASTEGD